MSAVLGMCCFEIIFGAPRGEYIEIYLPCLGLVITYQLIPNICTFFFSFFFLPRQGTIEDYMWFKLSFVTGDVLQSDVLKAAQV